jgi:hypothetical protein
MSSAVVVAAAAMSESAEGSVVSPWVFGGVAFGALMLLLVITLLLNVDR